MITWLYGQAYMSEQMYAKPENGGIGTGNDDEEEIDLTTNKFDRGFGGPNK